MKTNRNHLSSVLVLIGFVLGACSTPAAVLEPTAIPTTLPAAITNCGGGAFTAYTELEVKGASCDQNLTASMNAPVVNIFLQDGGRELVLHLSYTLEGDAMTGAYWIHYAVSGEYHEGSAAIPVEPQCDSLTPLNPMDGKEGTIDLVSPHGVFQARCEFGDVVVIEMKWINLSQDDLNG
ncbi:hypothetical protein A2886_02975 [candidate division WWE3 bacterium RIFCSPHIGHO2_01_FULL_42_13]|uniref:Uncharacterized protein n=1 Tax=candidate division WWE3 bacterium RIFCSPHIGHO2_01_FULL_42_13 TaxID=1802617 RepID=A0A1F4URY2_UNCKA|nr:MAG: hypothetical protein A2886_02975 [candidate division WWE3 bacterium RIFCSPHIGHO2_01_FULL_42_13]